VTVAAVPSPVTKRYLQLVNWLWELGVCWRSRYVLAAAQVERELTGVKDYKTELTCDDAAECREKAKRGWSSMPAR